MTDTRLRAYLDRIALQTPPAATADGLATLVAAHRQNIGFSNLEIRLGAPVRIDSDSAFDKVVTRRRGGFCFEQNRVFSDMLTACGMTNRPLMARVRLGPAALPTPGRSHVTLLVDLGGEPWIADAGFGGSYVPPLPLIDGAIAETTDGVSHRLRRIGEIGQVAGQWLLERAGVPQAGDGRAHRHDDWQPQYSFDLGEIAQVDLEHGSHWCSTRPGERFTSLHVSSIVLPAGFASLVERRLSIHSEGESDEREIDDPADYAETLRTVFRLDFSDEDAAALPLFA